MNIFKKKNDLYFFGACLCLGIIAEQILENYFGGVSFIILLSSFYGVFYLRFRKLPFSNLRLGTLLLFCTLIIASTFVLKSNVYFQLINFMILPLLIMAQLVLFTNNRKTVWYHWSFLSMMLKTIAKAFKYTKLILSLLLNQVRKRLNERANQVLKKIIIGLLISVPILLMVLLLLSSADLEFKRIVFNVPKAVFQIQIGEEMLRFVSILVLTFGLFSLMQVLFYKTASLTQHIIPRRSYPWDPIIIWTLLISLNLVYLLFTVVQFRYLFNDQLIEGLTYAEYARKGFFELMIVTILNLSILIIVLSYMKHLKQWKQQTTKVLLTLLVIFTGIMLISAFLRLMMYEDAYGFTFSRVLAHSFMLYVMVLLLYTFFKIWIERLSLVHFFLLSGLVYYTSLNVLNIDQLVVNENIERFEKTGKVDVIYLNRMSYTGLSGLIELYEDNPEIPQLKQMLKERKLDAFKEKNSWWQWNWSKEKAYKELKDLQL
jgi:hypothetical protein